MGVVRRRRHDDEVALLEGGVVLGTVAGRQDVTLELHPEERIVRALRGSADLRLAGDAAELLGPHTVCDGYLLELGIVLGGSASVG